MNAIFQFKQLFSNNVSFNVSTPFSDVPFHFFFTSELNVFILFGCICPFICFYIALKIACKRKAQPKQNRRHNCTRLLFCNSLYKNNYRGSQKTRANNNALDEKRGSERDSDGDRKIEREWKFTMNKLRINRKCFCTKNFNGFTLVFRKHTPNAFKWLSCICDIRRTNASICKCSNSEKLISLAICTHGQRKM